MESKWNPENVQTERGYPMVVIVSWCTHIFSGGICRSIAYYLMQSQAKQASLMGESQSDPVCTSSTLLNCQVQAKEAVRCIGVEKVWV